MPNSIPTEPGFYWYRDINEGDGTALDWEIAQVLTHQDGVTIDGATMQPEEVTGEWGPRIPDPDETRETDEAVKRSVQTAHDFTRDKLAERFLVGILASGYNRIQQADEPEKYVALAYRYADAMIEGREKRNGN